MGDTRSSKIFKENKRKDEGENKTEQPIQHEGKDKENGSSDKRMGELFSDRQSQQQDERVGQNGKNKIKDRNMETMEEAENKTNQFRKVRY